MKSINIGEAELEIMKVIWKSKTSVTSVDIGREVSERGWKKTTIATFLTRLTEKGALISEKHGNLYYYSPGITEKEYKRSQIINLVKTLYNGSAREFALSFFDEKMLSDKDIEELQTIFNEREE